MLNWIIIFQLLVVQSSPKFNGACYYMLGFAYTDQLLKHQGKFRKIPGFGHYGIEPLDACLRRGPCGGTLETCGTLQHGEKSKPNQGNWSKDCWFLIISPFCPPKPLIAGPAGRALARAIGENECAGAASHQGSSWRPHVVAGRSKTSGSKQARFGSYWGGVFFQNGCTTCHENCDPGL